MMTGTSLWQMLSSNRRSTMIKFSFFGLALICNDFDMYISK